MENEPHAVRYKIWKQLTKPIKKKQKTKNSWSKSLDLQYTKQLQRQATVSQFEIKRKAFKKMLMF